MAQKKYTDGNGVSEIWLNIKNYVYSQLLGKADYTHTHTKSEITDFPTNYVTTDTAQTIGGQKTFTASPRVTRTFPDIALNISDCDVTEAPTEAKFATLYFRDKNNKNLAYIVGQQRINGTKRMCLRTHRTDNINNYYSVNLDSDGDFYPEQNNTLRLGTPALQWNNAYTRNILIDNDINIASSVINKTSNSGNLTLRGGTNIADGALIGLYGKDFNGGLAGNIYMTAYGNSDYTNFRIYPNGTMSVYNNSTNTTKNIAMQEDLATVATSGSYNDLSNKPTIPTVNNATLTIQKNGTNVAKFTSNSNTNVTANITVPTKVSELTNDSGFLTGVTWNDVNNKPSFATVATSGSYNDLSDKPSPFTPPTFTYDSSTETLTITNLVFSYDSTTETLTITY